MVREIEQEFNVKNKIRIGCMIEIPSAALLADHFAKECDFLSIGTNDLSQYSLAAHRDEGSMLTQSESLDPSVIRLIKMVIAEGTKNNIPITLCGEIASDPRFTPLLLGLGITELSTAPRNIPIIKNAISQTDFKEAGQLAQKALKLSSAKEISDLLSEYHGSRVCF